MFEEGTVVIPGQVSYSDKVATVQLASNFAGETIVPSQYFNATNPVIITGATTGVKARVIGFKMQLQQHNQYLYFRYLNTGSDFETDLLADSENIGGCLTQHIHSCDHSLNSL